MRPSRGCPVDPRLTIELHRQYTQRRADFDRIVKGLEPRKRSGQSCHLISCVVSRRSQIGNIGQLAAGTHRWAEQCFPLLAITGQRNDVARQPAAIIIAPPNLLASGPGCLAFRPLAAGRAGIFLQLVCAIERRGV